MSPGKRIRYRLEWIAVLAAVKLVSALSRRMCFRLGQSLGALAAVVDWKGRRIAESNLIAAFGERFSKGERAQIIRGSYQQFIRTMLDLLWSPRMNAENFREWYDVVNLDEVMAEVGPGRSVIFVTFHYGNFEWAAHTMGLRGLRGMLLAQEFKNPLLDPIFNRLRTHTGNESAPRAGGLIRMYKALKRGKHIALLVDLTLKPREPAAAVNCFGFRKYVTYAHAWLQQRTGAAIVPVVSESLGDGRYRLLVQPEVKLRAGASIAEITQACWDRLEPIVAANPAPWIWMYKHWRYWLTGAAKEYPFYAQRGRNFEARLKVAMAELTRDAMGQKHPRIRQRGEAE